MSSSQIGSRETKNSLGQSTIVACRIERDIPLDSRNPAPEWSDASPIIFCADWQGQHANPARQTEVRLLSTAQTLYVRFVCRYREIFVFDDSDPDGRRDCLWDRDVAEAFLQPDPSQPRHYKEFEVGPNGMWIDLQVSPRTERSTGDRFADARDLRNLGSGLKRSVWIDQEHYVWTAEMSIPMNALVARFDANAIWHANFYRVEGRHEPRFYSAWLPTKTRAPNFHVPEAFGKLRFV
jgi:hypothetical protein